VLPLGRNVVKANEASNIHAKPAKTSSDPHKKRIIRFRQIQNCNTFRIQQSLATE